MITINRPMYLPVVLNLEGVGDLLIAIKVNGTPHEIVCAFTVPRKWPSLLDAYLIPDFWGNEALANLPQHEKGVLINQIKTLRETIVAHIKQSLEFNSENI